jgi:hypothetical protein
MNGSNDRTLWRGSFIAALNVLALAAAHLPVGVADPILGDASAVELYTGGLWATPDVDLVCAEARPVMTELFATGFRWIQQPGGVRRVLRHPDLQVGVKLVERRAPLRAAEEANVIVVAIDLRPAGRTGTEPFSLKVAGVEDLIVRHVGGWLRDRAGSGEAAGQLQALLGLAREGVGGPLRAEYLQRRLAVETDGEVVLDSLQERSGGDAAPQLRRTSLTDMQATIGLWRDRRGLSLDRRRLRGDGGTKGTRARTVRSRHDIPQSGGERRRGLENVIALDETLPILPD